MEGFSQSCYLSVFHPIRQGIRFLFDRQLVVSSTYQMFRLGNAAHGRSLDQTILLRLFLFVSFAVVSF